MKKTEKNQCNQCDQGRKGFYDHLSVIKSSESDKDAFLEAAKLQRREMSTVERWDVEKAREQVWGFRRAILCSVTTIVLVSILCVSLLVFYSMSSV